MTKELQTIQRQIFEQAATLPRTDVFGQQARGLFAVGQMGAMAAEQLSVEQAGIKGLESALSEKGTPRKLAPGVTKATRAFNEAYNKTQTSLHVVDGKSMMRQKLIEMTSAERINSASVGEANAMFDAIIDGVLQGTNPENRAAVAIGLNEAKLKSLNKVALATQKYTDAKINEDFEHVGSDITRDLKEAWLTGDEAAISDVKQRFETLITDMRALGRLTDNAEAELRESYENTRLASKYVGGYLKARAGGYDNEYMLTFSKSKPKDLTTEQWFKISSEINAIDGQQERLVSGLQSLNYKRWSQAIDGGQVESIFDLDRAKQDVNASQFIDLENQFLNKVGKQRKEIQKQVDFTADAYMNRSKAINNYSSDTKNATYENLLEIERQKRAQETGNPDYELNLFEKSQVQKSFPVPFPAFNQELETLITSENVSDKDAFMALATYRNLAGDLTKPEKSEGLNISKDAERKILTAMFLNTYAQKDPATAFEMAHGFEIKKKDDFERQAKEEVFNRKYGNGSKDAVKNMKSFFKDVYGADPDLNPIEYQILKNALKINNSESMNMDIAEELTRREMKNVYSISERSPLKGKLMMHAPEKTVDKIDFPYWYDNQKLMYIQKLTERSAQYDELVKTRPQLIEKRNGLIEKLNKMQKEGNIEGEEYRQLSIEADDLTFKINITEVPKQDLPRWSMEGREVPRDITEADILGRPFNPFDKYTIFYKGKKREIFEMGDPSTTSRNTGLVTYPMYYLDDAGNPQPVEDPMSPRGVAEWGVIPMEEFVAEYAMNLEDRDITSVAKGIAKFEFEKGPAKELELSRLGKINRRRSMIKKARAKRQYVEERLPEIEAKLRGRMTGAQEEGAENE